MIYIKLLGGLGNQMFQYALGRNLALKNNDKLSIDLSELLLREKHINHTHREFELDVFNITYASKINKIPEWKIFTLISKKLFPVKPVIEQNHFFNPQILDLKGNISLNGFWQTELYFKEIEDVIRKDFSFKQAPNVENSKLLNVIENSNSVSIHFRRGDYVTNSNALNFHGVCSKKFYQNSINHIKQHVVNPHFFVFSDEINWVKNNIEFQDRHTFIENNKSRNHEDMRLMLNCKHNIIANSSFSWWGAWLNNNPDKIVIAPKQWFVNEETEIIPDNWIKIEN